MALLAAALLCAPPLLHAASNTASIEPKAATSALPDDNVAHEIRLQAADPGSEHIMLTARLSEDGGLIQQPIDWTVRDADGAVIVASAEAFIDIPARPGEYRIEARYGTMTVMRDLSLPEGQTLGITFILNAGGLRVLSKIKGLGRVDVQQAAAVYAMNGLAPGKLITTSYIPGEVLRLPAGTYRIESRFEPGNAVALTEVTVKAGRMSAVEIGHHAGLARFAAPGDVAWEISNAKGEVLPELNGANADAVLKPGRYIVRTQIDGIARVQDFTVEDGRVVDVVISR
jgi:hypothetical protein